MISSNAVEYLTDEIVGLIPDEHERILLGRVATFWPAYGDTGVTGVGSLRITLADSEFPCGWLRSLDVAAREGAISVGTKVLVLRLPDIFVAIDVFRASP